MTPLDLPANSIKHNAGVIGEKIVLEEVPFFASSLSEPYGRKLTGLVCETYLKPEISMTKSNGEYYD